MSYAASLVPGALWLCVSPWVARRLVLARPRTQHAMDSVVGGASIAYLVIGLLLEVTHDAGTGIPLQAALGSMLVGLVGFVALHAAVLREPPPRPEGRGGGAGSAWAYPAFAVLYGVYAFLGGAGLLDEVESGPVSFSLYVVVLGAHLAVNDAYLRRLFPTQRGLSASGLAWLPLAGALLWLWLKPSGALLDAPLAFLSGATLYQLVKEELPEPRDIRLGWFLAGVIGLSGLVAARWWL